MNEKLKKILSNMKKYNAGIMFQEVFGFDPETGYDALVIAPGWKPTKILRNPAYKVTELAVHSYQSGYLVEKDGLKVAWAQVASGGGNLIDNMIICAEMKFRNLIFAGAVGGLSKDFEIGDFCTPEVNISAVYANQYLQERLSDFRPFEKIYPNLEFSKNVIELAKNNGYNLKAVKVFCTDSIAMEYSHLNQIKETGAELIEMETGTFHTLAPLFEVPYIALLAVSDNSATGVPLLGRVGEAQDKYHYTRSIIIPDMIFRIAKEGAL
jgi:purine-nucleoside phosphorylase